MTSDSSVDRFYRRHAITFKKSLHAAEQARPDVAEARERRKAGQASLDPTRLVFVDETGANTKMVRLMSRWPSRWDTRDALVVRFERRLNYTKQREPP